MQVGDRVVCPCGTVGHIEAIEDGCADVRALTPNNEPSCCITVCDMSLLKDGTNVMPQPRSKAWWREANEFIGLVNAAATELTSQ